MPHRLAALLLVLALTGCGDGGGRAAPTPAPPPSVAATAGPTTSFAPSDPLSLLGSWYVGGAGVEAGAALTFGRDLTVFLRCGALSGQWKAERAQGLLVGDLNGFDQECSSVRSLPWLQRTRSFRVSGAERLLLDATGSTVATLRPGARPTFAADHAPAGPDSDATAEQRAALEADPPPLVEGVEPPTPALLQHRWVPSGPAPETAYVSFAADGSWVGSDGCNGQGGRYVLGAAGRWLATAGPSTLIGCRSSPVGQWVERAARLGVVEGDLVLYDNQGIELGQLSPAV